MTDSNNRGGQGSRDNTNSGYLYPNDKKLRAEQPDYKGKVNVAGTDFWLSAWNKVDQKTGGPCWSVKVTKVEPRQGGGGYGGQVQQGYNGPSRPMADWQAPPPPTAQPPQQFHGGGQGYAQQQPPVAYQGPQQGAPQGQHGSLPPGYGGGLQHPGVSGPDPRNPGAPRPQYNPLNDEIPF
jgi:hypothetical protein